MQLCIESAVLDHHVGFQVERETQRIEIAGAHGRPLVVHERHLAVQGTVTVFVNLNAGAQQMVVQQTGSGAHNGHVGPALQDKPHIHTPLGRTPHLANKAVAGEEVGIGNHNAVPRGSHGHTVMALNVLGVAVIVARDKHRAGRAEARAAGECAGRQRAGGCRAHCRGTREVVDLRHQRAAHLHRVVLLGVGAKVGHVVGRIVDAADKGQLFIDHHNFSVHAAQHIEPLPQYAPARIEGAKLHARSHQAVHKVVRQIGRTKAIHQNMDLHTAHRRAVQRCVQLPTNLVVKQDESF